MRYLYSNEKRNISYLIELDKINLQIKHSFKFTHLKYVIIKIPVIRKILN